ncbi:hypothetical protein B0J14DRAFT_659165 [Halenospora varia]|nr:hypothetical protein B0J14DRAFT_659165 [Halenospora varia]
MPSQHSTPHSTLHSAPFSQLSPSQLPPSQLPSQPPPSTTSNDIEYQPIPNELIIGYTWEEDEVNKAVVEDVKGWILDRENLTMFNPIINHGWSLFASITIFVIFEFKDRQASWYISRNHSFFIARNRSIKAKQVVDAEATWRHGTISTRQARRGIPLRLDKLDGFEDDSFGLFPSYVAELKAVDPNTYAEYRLNDTTNAFQAVFIAPGPLRQAIPHLRHFFALDGTHTRSKYRMILAITVALDSGDINSRTYIVAGYMVAFANREL